MNDVIDQLNDIKADETIEEEIKQYFSEMEISDEQKEERENFAKELFEIMALFFFFVHATEETEGIQDIEYYIQMLRRRYGNLIGSRLDDYLTDYVNYISLEITNATFNNINDDYFLSKQRALDIAETEANTVLNYTDYEDAINNGFTKKTWKTERDNRVRKSHMAVDGQTIGIKDYFKVGGDEMLYPHDLSQNPKPQNIIGCRCVCIYSK